MRSKPPVASDALRMETREERLKAFMSEALEQTPGARPDAILVVARSPESAVARAIFALSPSLAARSIGARMVFASSSAMASGEVWQLSFDRGFAHEIRLVANPRFLAAHEQLVIGDGAVWFGDSMRREPDKRDAFSSYSRDGAEALRARQTFARLWAGAEPLYVHQLDGPMPIAVDGAASGVLPPEAAAAPAVWHAPNRH